VNTPTAGLGEATHISTRMAGLPATRELRAQRLERRPDLGREQLGLRRD
jgi:hypothetical protein